MWKSLLDIFLKPNCPLCDRVAENNHVLCRYCDRQLLACKIDRPSKYWAEDLPLFVWGKYDGLVKRSLHQLKYEGGRDLGELFGELLADSWLKYPPLIQNDRHKKITIIPIPLHLEKLKSRGFNQAELIARRFCQITGDRLDLSLERTKSTAAQFGLSPEERQSNIASAFSLSNRSSLRAGTQVLLVDDIYTTGATVREAKTTLTAKGIDVCGAIVFATSRN